jgi:hypothetical protein
MTRPRGFALALLLAGGGSVLQAQSLGRQAVPRAQA